MIQPQEIRIGNNVNTEFGIAEVIGIYEDVVDVKGVSVIDNSSENKISISTRSFDGCVEYEKIQPIPLTEEILLNFGFYFEEGFYCLRINNTAFMTIILHGSYVNYELSNFRQKIVFSRGEFSGVHQLQNLYFALTGEELKFK